jgi:hypothetical protein
MLFRKWLKCHETKICSEEQDAVVNRSYLGEALGKGTPHEHTSFIA